jgi:uroporphyrin-III C-methyltransferase/precorrin-2 dehydrogenase/sirohydrochlorin ferrochelatase
VTLPIEELQLMRFLPVFLDLTSGTVALIGTASAALVKLRLLRSAGANVRWYVDNFAVAAQALADGESSRIEIVFADPLEDDFAEFIAVVAAPQGEPLDGKIAARARAKNVPVNVVDRPDLSTFIFPAIVDRGEVVAAIGTGGASPVLARRLRERIEALLPARIGGLAALMGRFREAFAERRHCSCSPRRFWEDVVDGPIGAAALAGQWEEAEAALMQAIETTHAPQARCGVIFVVSAGPGDPDLLTLRALQALQGADLVFHDEAVTPEVLDRARREAELICVPEERDTGAAAQEEINRRMLEAAQNGRSVVRLKTGDIHDQATIEIFHKARVQVAVIPGVTVCGSASTTIATPADVIAA